jgi:nucleoside-diphosphate-sugar epimerase
MKILVTGAGGFVGANLVRRLVKENHEVYAFIHNRNALDVSGVSDAGHRQHSGSSWRLQGIDKKDVNWYHVDIRNRDDVEHHVSAIKPQGIFHMATYGAYPDSQKDSDKIYDVNLIGTINMIRAWDGYEVFINTSSSSVYGKQEQPMRENMERHPEGAYAISKLAAEYECQTRTQMFDAPIINTRLFSVYGPYEEPNRLIISTIQKCLAGEKMKFTQGTQKRDFIHMQDVEDAYLKLLRKPELAGEVLNIGTGKQWSVRQAVQKIMKATDYDCDYPSFGAIETRKDETFNWVANMNKTWKRLGWKAEIGFDEGIQKTVDWVKQNTRVVDE